MRVVLDTNILISATFWAGKPKQIINMVRRGEIRFLTSRSLLDELKEILVRDDKPFRLSDAEASHIVKTIEDLAEIVQPRCNIDACTHEADNRVLEIAMEGKAKWIITGDSHLLDLVSYEGVGIVTVSEFIIRRPPTADL